MTTCIPRLPENEPTPVFSDDSEAGPQIGGIPGAEFAALRAIVEGTAEETGDKFFQALVEHLAKSLGVSYAFVAEFAGAKTRVRTLAYWTKDRISENIEFDLEGTPCQDVIGGKLCHHPTSVQRIFPADEGLIDLGIESYLGVPLRDSCGVVLGHLAVFHERPMPPEPRQLSIFRIFAARAAAELNRLRMEQLLKASEQRYRDLFDEAPIAYVYEDTDTRFVSVNRAGMKLLGLKPQDVPGTVGWSLVAKNTRNEEQLAAAFKDIQQGKERGLVELELRRKDDGRPVWVQFWSRPEPDGKHTRTMIIDITDRVLAEREQARLLQQNAYLPGRNQGDAQFRRDRWTWGGASGCAGARASGWADRCLGAGDWRDGYRQGTYRPRDSLGEPAEG